MAADTKLRCSTCGDEGDCGGAISKCANCWEVEKRIVDYVKSEQGAQLVAAVLTVVGYTVTKDSE